MWLPSGSGPIVAGLEHGPQAPPSRRHWNVEPASVAVNVNDGAVAFVTPVGPPVMLVSGAVVSTVNDRVAGLASTLPAVSVSRTENV